MQKIFSWFRVVRRRVRRVRRTRRVRGRKSQAEYEKLKESARVLVKEKLEYWNQFYSFSYKRIFIRAQRTRWGSCSSRGNLSFNYRILFLSPELQDYLIVHELCHLSEMNHGSNFWVLVGRTIPKYKTLRRILRKERPFPIFTSNPIGVK